MVIVWVFKIRRRDCRCNEKGPQTHKILNLDALDGTGRNKAYKNNKTNKQVSNSVFYAQSANKQTKHLINNYVYEMPRLAAADRQRRKIDVPQNGVLSKHVFVSRCFRHANNIILHAEM